MKKEIKLSNVLIIGGIVLIIYMLTVSIFMNKINNYEERLRTESSAYTEAITENDKLKNNIDELNQNVYKAFNKQPYKLTIKHDDSTITYRQDKFGLFDSYSTSITSVY